MRLFFAHIRYNNNNIIIINMFLFNKSFYNNT